VDRRFGRTWWVAIGVAAALGWTSLAVVDAGHAAAAGGVVFGGQTSQGEPVIIVVNARRTRVARVLWEWRARCVLGPAAPAGTPLTTAWSDVAERFAINGRGRWSGSYAAGPFPDASTGVTKRFTYRLAGAIVAAGARMTGTIRATYTETSAAGVIRTCHSGAIAFNILD
jgi:hypothetical protein